MEDGADALWEALPHREGVIVMSATRSSAATDGASSAKSRLLLAITLALSQERDLRVLLRRFTQAACELLDAQYGALFIEDVGRLQEFITYGLDPETEGRIRPLPTRTGLHGFVLREGKTLRIDDLTKDRRCVGFPPHHPVMRSFIGTPIRYHGQTLGELFLTEKRDGAAFSAEDEEILEALAAQAAVAYENARLLAKEREAADRAEMLLELQKSQHGREGMLRRLLWAQEEERARVARELHDGLGQALTSIALFTKALENDAPCVASMRLTACRHLSEQALVAARSLMWQLRPMELDDLGLLPVLDQLCAKTQEFHHLRIHLHCRGLDQRLGREAETVAYRIIQEALSNVVKHAKASLVTIYATHAHGHLKILVQDDGVGFEPAALTNRGLRGEQMGLLGMRERAESVDGKLTIDSELGRGSTVMLEVPVANVPSQGPRLTSSSTTYQPAAPGASGAAKVLLLDDHAVVREGLRLLLDREKDLEVCGEASTLDEVACFECDPDVVLTDLMLGEQGGPNVVVRLREQFPNAGVLVLSMVDNPRDIHYVLRAGGSGYLLKGADGDELVDAVRRVARGEEYVQPCLGGVLARWRERAATDASVRRYPLTPRQREVLALVVRGHTNVEIARLLNVTVRTVEAHRMHICQRLGVKTRAELVRYAVGAGLVDLTLGAAPPAH
jgi:signal transduction histidine kinase/DNA-binding NarL/FixJ family response regulator